MAESRISGTIGGTDSERVCKVGNTGKGARETTKQALILPLLDALEYCQNDDNSKRNGTSDEIKE